VNVRIPRSPEMLLYLIREFSRARDDAAEHGEPWPEDLDAWSDELERHHATGEEAR
jgi:hypothetical protein